jgi:hypothetical protein
LSLEINQKISHGSFSGDITESGVFRNSFWAGRTNAGSYFLYHGAGSLHSKVTARRRFSGNKSALAVQR